MPIMRTHKQSDIEKRLKLLNMQLYGKGSEQLGITRKIGVSDNQPTRSIRSSDISDLQSPSGSFRTDLAYLKQDLRKILILASLAIAAQFIIYFSQLSSKLRLF